MKVCFCIYIHINIPLSSERTIDGPNVSMLFTDGGGDEFSISLPPLAALGPLSLLLYHHQKTGMTSDPGLHSLHSPGEYLTPYCEMDGLLTVKWTRQLLKTIPSFAQL